MSTKRQKERKKKGREDKARARVLARRQKIREINRQETRSRMLDDRFREKLKPIVKDPEVQKSLEESEQKRVQERLERNMQILKALEEEYEAEQNRKKEIGEELEAQGHTTLKEKFDALEAAARAEHGEDSASAQEISDSEKIH
jgi:hypothetical protein